HGRVVEQHLIDFLWSNFLPAAIDHLANAADQKQKSVGVEMTEVSRLEPTACKGGLGRAWIPVIALRNACASNDDLARLSGGQQPSSLVHDRNVQNRWDADRARLAQMEWITCDRGRGDFRHSVPFDHRTLKRSFEFGKEAGWQRSGR